MRITPIFSALILTSLLAACASSPRSLYYWGDFPDANYAWLQEDTQDDQKIVELLEKGAQRAVAQNHDLPPGFHAHLGLLYLRLGEIDKAAEHWQAEKLTFPESAPFMDFQLRNLLGEKAP